ncbi:MAG: hypothetical protein AAB592_04825 [Patescibacteria group bacterium]
MSIDRAKQRFGHLPFGLKLVGIGGVLLALSTLMPWYSDVDAYQSGALFLGITGPGSFAGIIILLMSLGSSWLFLTHVLERRRPKIPVKESVYHTFVGLQSLFLLFIISSVYFHPEFGLNITLKQPGFGLIIAFLSSVLLSYGGYAFHKQEQKLEDSIGRLEPLVSMPEKSQVSPSTEDRASASELSRVSPLKDRLPRNFSFGEQRSAHGGITTSRPMEHSDAESSAEQESSSSSGGGSFKIRMDL